MRRNRVRLTESQLHRVIKESVKKVIKENDTNEMAIDRISRGSQKGKVAMDESDYAVFKKAYNDIIKIMEKGTKQGAHWNDDLNGQTLREIWDGPLYEMGRLFRRNMSNFEWKETIDGLEHYS